MSHIEHIQRPHAQVLNKTFGSSFKFQSLTSHHPPLPIGSTQLFAFSLGKFDINLDIDIYIDIDIIDIDIDIDIALKQLSQQTLNQRRKEARIQIDKTWQKISLFIVVALT